MRDLRPQISKFYDTGTKTYLRLYGPHFHDGYYTSGRESQRQAQEDLIIRLAGLAGITRGTRVLDVGCGVGGSSIWLAKNREAVTTGITISQVQVNIAKRLAGKSGVSSEFHLMDAMNIQLDKKFDVIWIVDALVHLPDQHQFLQSSFDYLTPGGKLVIFDWMLKDDAVSSNRVEQVIEDMLLSGLVSMAGYQRTLTSAGYHISHAEDVTSYTVKTWQDALSVTRKFSFFTGLGEIIMRPAISLKFLRAVLGMRREMLAGRIRSGIIVAEKSR